MYQVSTQVTINFVSRAYLYDIQYYIMTSTFTPAQNLELSRIMKDELSRVQKAFTHGAQTTPPSHTISPQIQTHQDDQTQRLVHLTQMATDEQKKDIVKFLVFGIGIIVVVCAAVVVLFTTDFGKDIQRNLKAIFGVVDKDEEKKKAKQRRRALPPNGSVLIEDEQDNNEEEEEFADDNVDSGSIVI